ncbi:uncharacterized protein LOC129776661 [Toxorhynchites rutilus septentrionalis]|uniref:uncharacterized protein LOC129776661 n=1 Tax=Toxorhynchites rutilus septentrionalis TaxID=329112 RepID=UPI002478D1B1|nr:uncharacterized protein LOC129776661 [Toxorhynchites rutilus septentrionalis]
MVRIFLVFLLLGTVVLAGPVIRNDHQASNTSEDDSAQEGGISSSPDASVPESSSEVSSSISETSSNAVDAEAQPEPIVPAPAELSTSSSVEQTTTTVAAPTTTKARKTITFDQRQQGKFNIRADLENFVIVVVPSSPSAGISLLDLLNRSGQKHSQKKKSGHRKGTKSHGAQKKVQRIAPEVVVLDDTQTQARVDNDEFIEGRTPYKVDISSTARSSNSALPSPIYRVVRPLAFNVEQPTSSNMIRFPAPSGNYYASTVREPKSLPGLATYDDEIRTNTVYTILTNNNNGDGGIVRSEDDGIDDDNHLMLDARTYLDLPAYPNYSFDSLEYPRSDIDMMKLQLQNENDEPNGDGWELKLLGAQEQCGPDRKRDSYGVCQFVMP